MSDPQLVAAGAKMSKTSRPLGRRPGVRIGAGSSRLWAGAAVSPARVLRACWRVCGRVLVVAFGGLITFSANVS